MSGAKVLVILGVLAAVAAGGILLMSDPPKPPPPSSGGIVFTSSAQCAECHSEIYDEWRSSWHGQAYTDPDVLDLSENFADQQCISCHAPAKIWEIGIGERVFERQENRHDGVDCIACHVRADGRVVGMRGIESAPCRPVKDTRLGSAQFCAGCHDQHWTVSEFLASKWAETTTCMTCHVRRVDRPLADGGPERKGVAAHVFEGGHYLEMLQRAATMEAEIRDGKVFVRVTNSGAGHNIPTDARHRSFNVVVTVNDDEGNLLVDRLEIAEYRLYYREDHITSTQIPPFETREETYELPADRSGVVRVDLVYCLRPTQKLDKSWTVVKSADLTF